MSGASSLSEASASAAGYYYQIRYALLRALETLRHFPTAAISIEKLEDVAIEYDGGIIDLDQLKHTLLLDKFYGDAESAILLDELCEISDEHEKCASGRKLLGWAETLALPIRNARAQFLTSGSYHSLADNLIIGWHPDFKTKFAK